ncbi:MAG TPA: CHAT domain-containing protein, partial [Blastocatellia bacterium]|nr:CHAT domain-containing protein [Blastocatellia bacterium]
NATQAVELAERASALAREIGSREAFWDARLTAGMAYRALNQVHQARQAFVEAIATVEDLRTRVPGGEQQFEQFFENKITPYYQMSELLIDQGNLAEALAYVERAKGRALLDTLQSGRVDITKAMTSADRNQELKLAGDITSLNAQRQIEMQRSQPDQTRLRELDVRLDKARLDYEAFQTNLYAAHPELKVHRGEIQYVDLEQVGKLIQDRRTAFLEYAVTDDKTFVFVLTRSNNPQQQNAILNVYTLGIKETELAALVDRFRERIANRRAGYYDLSNRLYRILLAPLQADLQNKTHIVILPDRILWDLPFQALQSDPEHYLIENYAISYSPSLTVLREMAKSRTRQPTESSRPSATLVALGNPTIGSEMAARIGPIFMDEVLGPLPDAERQVKTIGRLYGSQHSKVYIRTDATEEVAKAEAGRCRILHLATHGIASNHNPMYSHLVLAQPDRSETEDGLLEAWEIMKLDVSAELVILSACDTARGRIGAGEGVVGLAWAFFVAGCPSTVVSQWRVAASSATELLIEFHRQLKPGIANRTPGVSKAEALRAAALKLLRTRKYRHPFHWAAFVMVGNPA